MSTIGNTPSPEKLATIYRALVQPGDEYLQTCAQTLNPDEPISSALFADLYERLACRQITKIEALHTLCLHYGFAPFSPGRPAGDCLDINTLLAYSPDDQTGFVSMLIDLAAERSPTQHEALQFEYQLSSGQLSRRQVLDQIVERYQGYMTVEGDLLHLRPKLGDTHSICQIWRGQLFFNPHCTLATSLVESQGLFREPAGQLLSCDIKLEGSNSWHLRYHVEPDGLERLELEVVDLEADRAIFTVSSRNGLIGHQEILLQSEPRNLRLILSCPNEETHEGSAVRPFEIAFRDLAL